MIGRIQSWKKLIISITLLAGSSVFALIFAELILRIFSPQPLYGLEQGLFANSEEYDYYLTPSSKKTHSQPEFYYTIETNSHGFRGKEPNFAARHRILVLGDSFGMGWGASEGKNLCGLSQSFFDKNGANLDIFNTSVFGYSGVNQVKVLRRFVSRYNPHLVILLFYWNDVGQTTSLQVQDGYLVESLNTRPSAPLRTWINKNSHLYCLAKRIYYSRKSIERGFHGGFLDADIEIAAGHIRKMKQICDANQVKFVVALLPLEGIYEGGEGFRRSKGFLVNLLERDSINVTDWTLQLPEKAHRKRLVYNYDYHWSEAGHVHFSNVLNQLIMDFFQIASFD